MINTCFQIELIFFFFQFFFLRELDEDCGSVQQKIIDQMDLWDLDWPCGTSENATSPDGQKCNYNVRKI